MFDTLFGGPRGRKPARAPKAHAPQNFRPRLEQLEDRRVPAAAIRDLTGFRANIMLPNFVAPPITNTTVLQGGFTDDGTSGPVDMGFTLNFFGNVTNTVFVNNNGNVTFGGTTTATPGLVNLPASGIPIIAPFFADVDTLFAPISEPVTFGVDNIGGHRVFGVDWINVTYFPLFEFPVKLNQFQLILIDRSDTGPGNFDIEFNYNTITWESGEDDATGALGLFPPAGLGARSALAGFSDGTGQLGHYFLLPGSGAPGQLLDTGIHSLSGHMLAASTQGRYHFFFRNGFPVPGFGPAGVDITRLLTELGPTRFVRQLDSIFAGNFFFRRGPGSFAPFLDDPVLDEVGVFPINSRGAPITLVFTQLPRGVAVVGASGVTASGFQFITLPASVLANRGDRLRVRLHFFNPFHVPLGTFYHSLHIEVFTGPFNPLGE